MLRFIATVGLNRTRSRVETTRSDDGDVNDSEGLNRTRSRVETTVEQPANLLLE